jgi:hypothetical protein
MVEARNFQKTYKSKADAFIAGADYILLDDSMT